MNNATNLLPGLEWIAPAVAEHILSNPPAVPTVEVEIVIRRMDHSKSLLYHSSHIIGRDPDPENASIRLDNSKGPKILT